MDIESNDASNFSDVLMWRERRRGQFLRSCRIGDKYSTVGMVLTEENPSNPRKTCHSSFSCDTEGSNSGIAENSSLLGCKVGTLDN